MNDSASTRRRLPADEARRRILEVAERELARVGPTGLKLTELAAELGISHPAILHHFGSREGLVSAVVRKAVLSLNEQLVGLLHTTGGEGRAILDSVVDFYGARGHARLLAWLALADKDGNDQVDGQPLRKFAEELLKLRGGGPEEMDELLFRIQVGAFALFGEALVGRMVRRDSGHPDTQEVSDRFRRKLLAFLAHTGPR
jgi:AcrR family transcriptional regulator